MTYRSSLISALVAPLVLGVTSPAAAEVRNIVLVHGAVMDGSSWRAVHDILTAEGYTVSMVQMPLTGLAEDVAATERVLTLQDGPVVLVGHSYGGAVVTVAGANPQVKALVYVAALQPDAGESVATLNAFFPPANDGTSMRVTDDGLIYVDPAQFRDLIAADVDAKETAFLAHAQVPTSPNIFTEEAPTAAWRNKPSFAIVARQDRSVSPDLQRWMYERSGATVTELEASHLPHVSQPEAVAAVIMEAAGAVR